MGRPLLATVAGALVLGLTGCSPATVDQAAAQNWFNHVSTSTRSTTGVIGSAGGWTAPDDDGHSGITISLESPGTASAADVQCFGGATASAVIEVRSTSSVIGVQADVPCDEQAHRVPLGQDDGVGDVTAVRINVVAEQATTYYAEIRS